MFVHRFHCGYRSSSLRVAWVMGVFGRDVAQASRLCLPTAARKQPHGEPAMTRLPQVKKSDDGAVCSLP
jgi:hypothetical protein